MNPQRRRHNPSPPLSTGILLTLGLLLCLAHPAEAQFIGDRIRITTESGEKIIGELQEYDASSLTLLADSAEQSVAYDDMAKLQRSLGRRPHYRNGALLGLGVGMVGGIVGSGGKLRAATLVGATLAGGLAGRKFGGKITGEQWRPLNHPLYRLSVGDRVRIKDENGKQIIGQMQRYDAYTLTILADSAEQTIAYADMAQLQRSMWKRSRAIEGIFIGGGTGLFASLIYLFILLEQNDADAFYVQLAAWSLTARMVGIGALAGLLVGVTMYGEKWERLDIPGQERGMSVAPVIGVHPNGRLALGARISLSLDRR